MPGRVTVLQTEVFLRSFQSQAKCWKRPRHMVARIKWHRGELFPRVGLIVTHLEKWSMTVVKFYNSRGTAEQWIKEDQNALKWTKLSCHSFKDNPMRLRLFTLAYNYSNFLPDQALFSDGETRVAHHAQAAACSRCKNPKSEPQIKRISTRWTPEGANCWNRKHSESRAVLGET